MDKVSIRELTVHAAVGILDWEKTSRQPLLLNLVYPVDAKKAAQTDCIEDTVSYADVRQAIINFIDQHRFNLLETLAYRLSKQLCDQFQLAWLQLEVTKPTIFDDANGVSVAIEYAH